MTATNIIVGYLAHPVAPTEEQIVEVSGPLCRGRAMRGHDLHLDAVRTQAIGLAVKNNLDSAARWLRWLVENTDWAISAPWMPYVQALGEDGGAKRERGLRDDCAMAARCDGIILVGGRLSSGMEREMNAVLERGGWVLDLLGFGPVPPLWDHLAAPIDGAKNWREYLEVARLRVIADAAQGF